MSSSGSPSRLSRLIQAISFVSRLKGRFLVWLLAPDLVLRLVARHSLLLSLLYFVFFACGKFRSLFRNRISLVKQCFAYLSGYENEYLLACSLKETMQKADSFDEWRGAASRLDAITGRQAWKDVEQSDLYDYRRIRADLNTMRELANERDIEGLMRFLRSRLQRNVGGIGNPKLYGHLLSGTKTLAEDYTREVVQCLNLVAMETESNIVNIRKLAFFMETRHAYGRSALLLSGGSTLGLYHAGVIKALLSKKLLPRIISGTSVGSIFAAMIGTRTDPELELLSEEGAQSLDVFPSNTGSIWRKLSRVWKEGYLYNMSVMEQYIRDNVGDFSFQEAYARTGRILNIAVSAHGSPESAETLLLNYLTAPNVLIWSAVCASCAIPFVFQPVELMSKEPDGRIMPHFSRGVMWSDGSVRSDLPMHRLAEMFNVNHFIVSQVNPHVVPFMAPQRMLSTSSSLIAKSILYLGGELRDLILRMSSLVVSKSIFCNLESIAFQNYLGDITLYPKPSPRDFLTLLENPTQEMYDACVQEAQLYTWRHMALISEHCDIEFELDACVRQIRAALLRNSDIPLMVEHRHPSENLGSRVRSWSSDQFQIFRRAEESCLHRTNSHATLPFRLKVAESVPAAVTTAFVPQFNPQKAVESEAMQHAAEDQRQEEDRLREENREQDLLSSELADVDMMPLP